MNLSAIILTFALAQPPQAPPIIPPQAPPVACNPACTCQVTGVCTCTGGPCQCVNCGCVDYDTVAPRAAKEKRNVLVFVNMPVRAVPGFAVCDGSKKYSGSGVLLLRPRDGWLDESTSMPATVTDAQIQRVVNPPQYQPPPMMFAPPMMGGFGGGMSMGGGRGGGGC